MFTFFSQGLINLDFWHYSAYLSKPFKFSYIPPPTAYKPHWWGLVYIALPPTSQYQFSLLVTEVIAMTKKKKKKNICKYNVEQRDLFGLSVWRQSLSCWGNQGSRNIRVSGHTASRVRNPRARNVSVHPFSCSSFPSVWDPTQWIDPTNIHQECFSSAKLLW